MRLIAHFEEATRRNPDREFLRFVTMDGATELSFTYAQANLEASRRARGLRNLGIVLGDRVALLQPNSHDWVLWYLAALKIGAVSVALNPEAPLRELQALVSDAGARLVLADDSHADVAHAVGSGCPNVEAVLAPGGGDGIVAVGDVLASVPAEGVTHDRAISDRSCVAVIFSSGTTGARPKAVMITDRQLVIGIGAYGEAAGIRAEDRIFLCTPIFHSCTLAWGITLCVLSGATIVLTDRFSASRHWQALERSGATVFWTMGSIIHILLQSPVSEMETRAVSRLRTIFAAGIGRQIRTAILRWPGVQLIDGYGLSESPGTIAFDDSFSQNEAYACIGRPVSSVRMRVIDPDSGRECASHETGEIVIDLDNGFAGYLNNPEANGEAIRGGLFHTGDLGYCDDEGRLYFVSRIKDIIRRGGQNISAGEVEQVALQHPNVAEAAAVPMPDDVLGEKVALFCVLRNLRDPLTLDALRQFCEGRLARYRIPEHLEIIAAAEIPRTATGKIAKFQLRQRLAAAH